VPFFIRLCIAFFAFLTRYVRSSSLLSILLSVFAFHSNSRVGLMNARSLL
jgi:hypothetical protein